MPISKCHALHLYDSLEEIHYSNWWKSVVAQGSGQGGDVITKGSQHKGASEGVELSVP